MRGAHSAQMGVPSQECFSLESINCERAFTPFIQEMLEIPVYYHTCLLETQT